METKYLDLNRFFEEIKKGNETLNEDDENFFDICEVIRNSELAAYKDWDSGIMAGRSNIYYFRGFFIIDDEIDFYGPFSSLDEAIETSGFLKRTDATTEIWINPIFKDLDKSNKQRF